jgi:hypothetical protein
MSFAGHVSDMISRMRNNREWHNARKARQKKILEAYQGHPVHSTDGVHEKPARNSEESGESNEK